MLPVAGYCMVTKVNKDHTAEPEYFDYVLEMYPQGAPCHSTLFAHAPRIFGRKHEVMVASCHEKCLVLSEWTVCVEKIRYKNLPLR